MTDAEEADESTRLLPAIPHRSYVYADELVIFFAHKKLHKEIIFVND